MGTLVARGPEFNFDIYNAPGVTDDVHEAYLELYQSAPPVFWTPENGGHWVINDGELALSALTNTDVFSNRFFTIPPLEEQGTLIPLTLDPPEHRLYRSALRPFFEPKAIEYLQPRIDYWAEHIIDSVAPKGGCEFVSEVSQRYPISVFMELMGFPLARFDEFRQIVLKFFGAAGTPEAQQYALEIAKIMEELIQDKRDNPQKDVMSEIVHMDFEGRKFNQEELMSIARMLFLAGLDTLVNALSFSMKHLASDVALQSFAIAHPDRMSDLSEELMRRYTAINMARYIAQDFELGGAQLRAGDMAIILTPTVGWSEKQNDNPLAINLDRPLFRHAAFGSGPHACLGKFLARKEMDSFYRNWFKKIGHFSLADQCGSGATRGGIVWALESLNLKWD